MGIPKAHTTVNVAASFISNADEKADETFLKLVAPSGVRNFTYREIRELACAYNAHFRSAGLRRGDVVAIILMHSVDLYGAFLGAMMAGLVPTIMPFPTPKQDHARYWSSHVELFAISGIRAIFTYVENMDEAKRHFGAALDHISTSSDVDLERKIDDILTNDLAVLQHSSGTTALKKGVMLTHRAIHAQVASYAQVIGLEKGARIVTWLPLYHDMGFIACFLAPMIVGCSIAHLDPFAWSARPTSLLDEIVAFGGEFVWLPNFAYNHIVNNIRPSMSWDLSRLRAVIDCSEPCKPATFERFRGRPQFINLRPTALQVCYAMAENVFAVTQTRMHDVPRVLSVSAQSLREGKRVSLAQDGEEGVVQFLSCGRTIDGVAINIIGPNGERLNSDGEIGEVVITGHSLYSGYYHRPEITAQKLVDGWHHTGDIGFIVDDELYIAGRVDDLLIVRGKNIYAHEVEEAVNTLGVTIPGRVVAFSAPNENLGTDDLVVICETAEDAVEAQVKRAIRDAVESAFGATVSYVGMVAPGVLVKTTSGKLSRRDNKSLFLRGSLAQHRK